MNVNEKLKYVRKLFKITGESAAKAIGFDSASTIYQYENGIRAVSVEALKSLAEFYKVPVEFFLNDNAVTLEEYLQDKREVEILRQAHSKYLGYIKVIDKAHQESIPPDELNKALGLLTALKNRTSD